MKKLIKWYFTTIANYVFLASLAWFIVVLTFFLLIDFPFSGEYWINSKFGWWIFNNFGVHPQRGAFWSGLLVFIIHSTTAWWIRSKYINWVSYIWEDCETERIWFKIILDKNKVIESKKALWKKERILMVMKAPTSREWRYGYISKSEPEDFEIHVPLKFEDGHLHVNIPVQIKMKINSRPNLNEIIEAYGDLGKSSETLKFDIGAYITELFLRANQISDIKEVIINYLRRDADFQSHSTSFLFLELLTRELIIPKLFNNFRDVCLYVQEPEINACKNLEEMNDEKNN